MQKDCDRPLKSTYFKDRAIKYMDGLRAVVAEHLRKMCLSKVLRNI